jgi:SAM-dependent methyltransferase
VEPNWSQVGVYGEGWILRRNGRVLSPATSGDEGRPPSGINYERLYDFRFRQVDQRSRQAVWNEIAAVIYERLGRPRRVLDPAGGRGEFLNAIPADERWLVDIVSHRESSMDPGVKVVIGSVFEVALPEHYFDGIFVSNLLEHFPTQDAIAAFLTRMRHALAPNGVLAVMGPNFKYCAPDYFDCADHTLALTHISVQEHLYAAGFRVTDVVPRFLPFSFRSVLPASPILTRTYLRLPVLWRLLGKQFLELAMPD